MLCVVVQAQRALQPARGRRKRQRHDRVEGVVQHGFFADEHAYCHLLPRRRAVLFEQRLVLLYRPLVPAPDTHHLSWQCELVFCDHIPSL